MFPSSYVEKLPPPIPSTPKPTPSRNSSSYPEKMPSFPNYQNPPYPAPSPYPYPQQNTYFNPPAPPPQNGPYPQYQAPPQGPPPTVVVAPAENQQQSGGKKHGIFGGGIGNTVSTDIFQMSHVVPNTISSLLILLQAESVSAPVRYFCPTVVHCHN